MPRAARCGPTATGRCRTPTCNTSWSACAWHPRPSTNPWFRTAPECFIVCCDHAESWHRPKDGKDHGDVDIAICAEHFCLAAAERGLGTCWVCNFDADLCRRLFHLPDTLEPVAFLPLGYEAADHQPRPFQRKEIDELWLTVEN